MLPVGILRATDKFLYVNVNDFHAQSFLGCLVIHIAGNQPVRRLPDHADLHPVQYPSHVISLDMAFVPGCETLAQSVCDNLRTTMYDFARITVPVQE